MDSPKLLSSGMAHRWARRFERGCCAIVTYFPLAFVYGITSWALWVILSIGSLPSKSPWLGS
jgi:palmitoyltransferase